MPQVELTNISNKLYDPTEDKTITDIVKEIREKVEDLKPKRSTPIQELSSYTLLADDYKDIDKTDLNGWSAIIITVKVTYGTSPLNGVRVLWLYSQDGTNYDTENEALRRGNYEDIGYTPSAVEQGTIVVPIFTPYVRIRIRNLDTANNVTIDAWTTLLR